MEIGVIGAGECFREKMLPALFDMGDFNVKWVVDILPAETVRKSLIAAGLPDKFKYFTTFGFMKELPGGHVDVVIDASPSRYHAHNLRLALESGKNIYVEKPFAINREDINKVEKALESNSNKLAYFTEYYRDEKGLGFRTLTGEIKPNDWYEAFMEPKINAKMNSVVNSLSKIHKIEGICLEGQGKKSGISHRMWVGDIDQGGQLLDMGTHLFSFLPFLSEKLGKVSTLRCETGVCEEAKEEYQKKFGRDKKIAETYVNALLYSDGPTIEFRFGKYTGVAQRYLKIRGENGHIFLDFETQQMDVKTPDFSGQMKVASNPKYSIIMRDLKRRLGNSGSYMFENSKQTLETILKTKEKVKDSFLYRAGDLTPIKSL